MKAMSELIKALYTIKAALLGENIGGNGGNNETNENGGKFDLMMSNIAAPDYICYCDDAGSQIIIIEPSRLTVLDAFEENGQVFCAYKERPSDNTKLYINEIEVSHLGDYRLRYNCYDSSSQNIDTVENTYIGQGYTIPQELLNCYCFNFNAGGGMA